MIEMIEKVLTHGLTRDQVKGGIVILLRAINIFFISWALGGMTYLGLGGGFAKADNNSNELKEIKARLAENTEAIQNARVNDLYAQLLQLRIEQCELIKNKKSAQSVTIRYNFAELQYVQLVNEHPRLPTCDELT